MAKIELSESGLALPDSASKPGVCHGSILAIVDSTTIFCCSCIGRKCIYPPGPTVVVTGDAVRCASDACDRIFGDGKLRRLGRSFAYIPNCPARTPAAN